MSKILAREIFHDALEAVLPENFMSKYCKLNSDILTIKESNYDLSKYNNLYVFGSGKAAYAMALEIEKIAAAKINDGLVIAPHDSGELEKIKIAIGSHPIPSQKSIDAAKKLVEMMQKCTQDDLYIFLLSGGSSALMEIPIEPITLEDLQETTSLMLSHNFEIHEINALRKHLSHIKGGRLAHLTQAQGVVLVISDIIDDALDSIGSAPLYRDEKTFEYVKELLENKNMYDKMPQSVQDIIEKGVQKKIEESPSTALQRVEHIILASNRQALDAANNSALEHGLSVERVPKPMQGDVALMVEEMLQVAAKSPAKCILFGGECTVELEGDGQGGRNQHAALLMLQKLSQNSQKITFLSASTDGIDGNSDAAGAVINQDDFQKTNLELQKFLDEFNSYHYLKSLDALVTTGPSGTNVIDIAILIKGD